MEIRPIAASPPPILGAPLAPSRAPSRVRRLFASPAENPCVVGPGGIRCRERQSLEAKAGTIGIADSMLHYCLWTEAGDAYCAGYNKDGRVGIGRRSDQEPLSRVAGLSGVAEMALGARSSCARTAQGEVWCWGDEASLSPTRVEGVDGVVAISSGQAEDRCFVRRDGTVWRSRWGQREPAPIPELSDVVAVGECYPAGLCALRRDETVRCVGSQPMASVPLAALTGVVQLASTVFTACALQRGGGVSCWGGRDGRGITAVPALRGATELAAGMQVCALLGDGSVWCVSDKDLEAARVVAPE